MIGPDRRAQPTLFPTCRLRWCRRPATETLLKDGKPFWCGKHLNWAMNLKRGELQ
jgi:hypothetical protein